jgi:hypothetical protein
LQVSPDSSSAAICEVTVHTVEDISSSLCTDTLNLDLKSQQLDILVNCNTKEKNGIALTEN